MSHDVRWIQGFVIGAMLGVVTGALLGVLYAPDKGVRTRRRIVRGAEELGDRASDAFESAGELVDRGRRRVGV